MAKMTEAQQIRMAEQALPGFPRIGQRVAVAASGPVMDWPFIGKTGSVIGYSLPHGFAIVEIDGRDVLLHPESLEVAK